MKDEIRDIIREEIYNSISEREVMDAVRIAIRNMDLSEMISDAIEQSVSYCLDDVVTSVVQEEVDEAVSEIVSDLLGGVPDDTIIPYGFRRKKGHWIVEDMAMNEMLVVLRMGTEYMKKKNYTGWAEDIIKLCDTIHTVMEKDGLYK